MIHHRRRLVALIACVRRHLGTDLHKIVEETTLEATVRITPAYGLDPALFFRFFYSGGVAPPTRLPETTNYEFDYRWDHPDTEAVARGEPKTWKDLQNVMITAVAGSAMLHRTLGEHGRYPRWDPDDWDVFVYMNLSLRYLGLWIDRVFANPVFLGDPDVLAPPPPIHAPVFGRPMACSKLTTCKWKMGQLVVNGTALGKAQFGHFDVEACETCVIPPFDKVHRSFEPGQLFRFHVIPPDTNPYGYDQDKIEVLRQRNQQRLAKYRARLGRHNVQVCVDEKWERVIWYDARLFGPRSRCTMDISERMTKHIDTQQ